MTLRITASAASQICLLADTFNDLIQIISDNENLRFYSRAIFKAYRGCWVGTPEKAYLITFLITNVICSLHPSLKKPSNCGFLANFPLAFKYNVRLALQGHPLLVCLEVALGKGQQLCLEVGMLWKFCFLLIQGNILTV